MTEDVRLLIYGAGGHGVVVVDAALCAGRTVIGIVDDDPTQHGRTVHGIPVLGGRDVLAQGEYRGALAILAIGRVADRRALDRELTALGMRFACVVHPSAHVAQGAVIGEGAVLLPMCVVHSDVTVGRHAIINTASTIDHDSRIGDFAHIAPGAHLAGNVTVGEGAHVGIGAAVTAGVTIGDGATVGAGAAVVEDVAAGGVVVGVPARVLRKDGND